MLQLLGVTEKVLLTQNMFFGANEYCEIESHAARLRGKEERDGASI